MLCEHPKKLRTIEDKKHKKVKNSEPQLRIYWFLLLYFSRTYTNKI